MKSRFLSVAFFLFALTAIAEVDTIEKQFVHDYGWPKGTNTFTMKFRIHLDPATGASEITVISHESPILTELAKEIVERWTQPPPAKNNVMFDDQGKPRYGDKDVIFLYTFRTSLTLHQIEGDAIGQIIKGGKLTPDQLRALAAQAGLLASPSPSKPQ